MRGANNEKLDMPRPKMDFPLPATLKGLTGDKDKFPTMSEFFDTKRKVSFSLNMVILAFDRGFVCVNFN